VSTGVAALLAPDPALPTRDELLAPADPDVEVARVKYRVGESLRVLYRRGDELVSVRATADGRCRWWRFPDDRRLVGIADVMAPSAALRELVGRRSWARTEVAEYAPERSLTARLVAGDGTTSGYLKRYAPGSVDVAALAARYQHVGAHIAAPVPIAWRADVLVLTAMAGRHSPAVASTAARLGAAIARLHELVPPAGTPTFQRLGGRRLDGAVAVIAAARPDVAGVLHDLRRRLAAWRSGGPGVLLHGDCHPKNLLVDGDAVALIDLDQAGVGEAAADIGSYLARLRLATALGRQTPEEAAAMATAFVAGYDAVRPQPSADELRWHVAAALLAEHSLRAVNRVRTDVLAQLPAVLAAAIEVAP
jgi:aminoglycoside phosphotransferase